MTKKELLLAAALQSRAAAAEQVKLHPAVKMADSATISQDRLSEPATPSPTTNGGPSPLTLEQEMLKKVVGLRMAHEAMMLEDARLVLEEQRGLVRRHQQACTGVCGAGAGEAGGGSGGTETEPETMGTIKIGDDTHYHLPPTSAAAVTPAPPSNSTLLKTLAGGAALAAALTPGGLGGILVSQLLRQPSMTTNIDEGKDFGLNLLPPDKPIFAPPTETPFDPYEKQGNNDHGNDSGCY